MGTFEDANIKQYVEQVWGCGIFEKQKEMRKKVLELRKELLEKDVLEKSKIITNKIIVLKEF